MADDDSFRNVLLAVVEILHELRQKVFCTVGLFKFKHSLVVKAVFTVHQHRNVHAVVIFGDTDDIGGIHTAVYHFLLFGGFFHSCDAVTKHGGLFKFQILCRLIHFFFHPLNGLCASASDEFHSLFNGIVVFLTAYPATANAHAHLYMIVETWPAFADILRKFPVAGGQHEHTVGLTDSFFCDEAAGVRSQIAAGLKRVFFVGYAWILLIGNADVVVSLVILQQDVVLGLMLLDKAAFEKKGFIFAVRDDEIVVVDI